MTKFMQKSFSVAVGSDDFRANWDRIFKRKPKAKKAPKKGKGK